MNTEPHPDNHYHLDDEPRYPAGSGSDEIDPDELAHESEMLALSETKEVK